jgi:hypothetical protein
MSKLLTLVLVLTSLPLAACSSENDPETKTLAGIQSKNGVLRGSFAPEPNPPSTGDNALSISLMDDQGAALAGADVGIEPWMPSMGHGSSTTPQMTELGAGAYRATNIQFTMPGHWELRVQVEAGAHSDSFLLEYDVK